MAKKAAAPKDSGQLRIEARDEERVSFGLSWLIPGSLVKAVAEADQPEDQPCEGYAQNHIDGRRGHRSRTLKPSIASASKK